MLLLCVDRAVLCTKCVNYFRNEGTLAAHMVECPFNEDNFEDSDEEAEEAPAVARGSGTITFTAWLYIWCFGSDLRTCFVALQIWPWPKLVDIYSVTSWRQPCFSAGARLLERAEITGR